MEARVIRDVRSEWRDVVLVCGKCSRKLGGGFGERRRVPLAKALRRMLGLKGRKARGGIVESKCLGVCPKRGVMVIDGRATDRWLMVPEGTPVEQVVARLGIGAGD